MLINALISQLYFLPIAIGFHEKSSRIWINSWFFQHLCPRLRLQQVLINEKSKFRGFQDGKCKTMHFGKSSFDTQYSMQDSNGNNHSLQTTTEEKDLGIWFDPSLKFSIHVISAVKKANQILGLIRRSFTFLDISLMKQLYTVMVRPYLEYGNVVWHPQLKKDIDLIEAVQHRSTKIFPGLHNLPYADRLKCMDLP